MGPSQDAGWRLSVYPSAGEAGGTFLYAGRGPKGPGSGRTDPDRAKAEAARRARAKVRRYCASNRLSRLGTLTYRGEGCHDVHQVRADVARFVRGLRRRVDGEALPYVWVPEWHKSGHGLHLHVAMPQFVTDPMVRSSWPHGFIDLGDGARDGREAEQARRAAGYLSKYVAKAFDRPKVKGLHRYGVGQGFQPEIVAVHGRTSAAALAAASELLGGLPSVVWESSQEEEWAGPPVVWAQWRI